MSKQLLRNFLSTAMFLAIVDACARIPSNPTVGSMSLGAGVAVFVTYTLPMLIKKAKVNLSDAGLSEYKEEPTPVAMAQSQNSQAA